MTGARCEVYRFRRDGIMEGTGGAFSEGVSVFLKGKEKV